MVTLNEIAPNSFLKGYRMFKDGNEEAAETFFQHCVDKDEFTAPQISSLRAFLKSHTNSVLNPDRNYSAALKLLEEVIESDTQYSPAFYLKGKLLANSNKPEEAFQALHEAVTTKNGYSPCRDINNPEEVTRFFSALENINSSEVAKRLCTNPEPGRSHGHADAVASSAHPDPNAGSENERDLSL